MHYIKAPIGHEILLDCQFSMDFNTATRRCTTELFYISTDGDMGLRDNESFCGQNTIRRTSLFNQIVLAYISSSDPKSKNAAAGSFTCTARAQQQACNCGWSVSVRYIIHYN